MSDTLETLHEKGKHYGMAVMERVDEAWLDPDLIARLPLDWARSRLMLPVRIDGVPALIAHDPDQLQDADDLALMLGCEPALYLAPASDIKKAIEIAYFNRSESTGDFLETLKEKQPAEAVPSGNTDDILRVSESAPVAQLVNLILLDAVKSRASDIHIEPYHNRVQVRFRLDGLLYERHAPPKHMEQALISRLKVMGHLDIAEKRLPQDGTARVHVGEREVDIRISTLPVAEGERVVLRLLNRENTLLPLGELGMPESMRTRLVRVLREPHGIIWVTGPTGSGKTTTLYAALQELDTERQNILTIEDPVEYQLPTISQMGVKPKIGLTFAQGLRHILRQDPDVILVGETRDLETAEIVVRASLTGHVVFSTLHTNDAAGALIRLVDMGIEPFLVAAATRGALAQRLVRVLCPSCRQPYVFGESDAERLGLRDPALVGRTFWRAGSCASCTEGYHGRIGVFEWLEMNTELQEIVRSGGRLQDVQAAAERAGMTTLLDDAINKAQQGLTSLEDVVRIVGMAPAP